MPRRFAKAALLFASLSAPLYASSGAQVMQVQPAAQTMTSNTMPDILIRFDAPVDPASVNAKSLSVFGRWSGVCPGEYFFEEEDRQIRFKPAKAFSAGEWITVALSKEIKSASGEAMAKGYAWNFWTAAQPGALDVRELKRINVRRAGEGKIRTYGAYAGDLNGDGFHDFTVPNEDAHDVRVFLNDGAGGYASDFKIYSLPTGSFPSTNEGADFNGDGLLDFAVGNIGGGSASVFFGDGQGGFSPHQTYPTAGGTRGLGVLDLNGDGAPDLATSNRNGSNVSMLRNRGDGAFETAVNLETGANGETSLAVADANGDGIMDAFVGSFGSREMVVMLGDGEGNLNVATRVDCRGAAWMIAAGDVNGDRHVDVVSANSNQQQLAVLLGDGAGNLQAAQVYNTGMFPLAIDLGDLDGDGDLDVVTSCYGSQEFNIHENDGTGRFTLRKRLQAQSAGSCVVIHDRDRDGDLDITGIDEEADLLFLFDNPGSSSEVTHSVPNTPVDFTLLPSYPNPFTAGTNRPGRIVIPFSLQRATRIRLELINVRGEIVSVLANAEFPPGNQRLEVSPENFPAGVYFYRLSSGRQTAVRKMLVLQGK